MSLAFWIRRAVTVYVLIAAVLFVVHLLKGNSVADATSFSALWALLSTSVVIGSHVYQSRRGRECAVCEDTSAG